MSERFFETGTEAEGYLLELSKEILAIPTDWDRNDFLGLYACHDARVMWFVEVTEEAISMLDQKAVDRLNDAGRTLFAYLDIVHYLLDLALERPAKDEASLNELDWRQNSIAMVEQLSLHVREKWLLDEAKPVV